ncbi:MAG: phage minor head protein [Sphingomonas pseudosanguinis]|uniref:phage minor head protein n=1 Tax=Sphingomonas pseudosanguinis TaxID=413712 RepID=UPI00391D640A
MPDQASAIGGVLRRPFREQSAYFRGKLGKLVPTARWDDIERQDHDTAFMVAGAQKADLLADLAASVDRAIVEGKSLEAFRKDFNAAVERHDWHGWTGEDTKGGRAWRTRTIYRTNASVSYAAGRRAQLEAGNFKYWVYRHGGSLEPRPEHLSWNGVALPPDHPFWETHYPPSDWGCSCYVVGARTAAGVRRLGGDPDKKLPDNWKALDPRTGAPVGIGKGWDYAPGASVAPVVQAAAEKMRHWDYAIGKAFYADLPPASRDAIAEAYRRLPSVADDARRYARRVLGDGGEAVIQPNWTLGGVTTAQGDAVEQLTGKSVEGFDFSLAPSDVLHVQRRHGEGNERDGQQVGVQWGDYALLPSILSSPDTVEDAGTSDVGEPLVRYSKAIDGLRYVAVMAIRNKRRTLALKTFYIRREA